MNNYEKTKRIFSVDLIRAICPFGILLYHYSCQYKNGPQPFSTYANGSWGYVFVTVFFMLSGVSLYHNYPRIKSNKEYYFKRVKAIFPQFYMVWLFSYFMKVLSEGGMLLYKGEGTAWKLLLTIIGEDGYLNGIFKGYYQVGEWFLGALVILYLLYPIILKLMEKKPIIFFVIIVFAFMFFCSRHLVENAEIDELITGFVGIPSCLLSFLLGIYIYKYKIVIKKVVIISLLFSITLVSFKFNRIYNMDSVYIRAWLNISEHIVGIGVFSFLFILGIYADNLLCNSGKRVIKYLSSLSYSIFLIHHKMIYRFYSACGDNGSFVLIISIIIFTIVFSVILNIVNKIFLESYIWNYIENKVLNEKGDNTYDRF